MLTLSKCLLSQNRIDLVDASRLSASLKINPHPSLSLYREIEVCIIADSPSLCEFVRKPPGFDLDVRYADRFPPLSLVLYCACVYSSQHPSSCRHLWTLAAITLAGISTWPRSHVYQLDFLHLRSRGVSIKANDSMVNTYYTRYGRPTLLLGVLAYTRYDVLDLVSIENVYNRRPRNKKWWLMRYFIRSGHAHPSMEVDGFPSVKNTGSLSN